MRLPEQRLWDLMRKRAPSTLWLQRIENAAGVGMPDVLCMARGGAITWIELKVAPVPKRCRTPLLGRKGLSPVQGAWMLKAALHGARTYVLVRDDELKLYLVPGKLALHINGLCRSELRSASVVADWDGIFARLST